jgi:hypothetical protein
MQLPRQRPAIARGISTEAWRSGRGVGPSFLGGLACRACKFACDRLPIGSGLCKRACARTVCR